MRRSSSPTSAIATAAIERAAGPADLLVVGDRRSRRLVVDHEREVGLVVAHAERRRRHHALELVLLAARVRPRAGSRSVAAGVRTGRRCPCARSHAAVRRGVVDRQRVDDAGARAASGSLREPRQPLRPATGGASTSSARLSRRAVAAEHERVVAELVDDVVDDAVVRGRGGAQHRHAARHEVEDPDEPAVVGPEVVAPVADAVRFVDHEQADARGDASAARRRGTAGWRSARARRAGGRPRRVRARLDHCSHSSTLSLVMRTERTPPRSPASIWLRMSASRGETSSVGPAPRSQEPGRDEVDRALAPAGPLDDEDPAPSSTSASIASNWSGRNSASGPTRSAAPGPSSAKIAHPDSLTGVRHAAPGSGIRREGRRGARSGSTTRRTTLSLDVGSVMP